MPKTPFACLHCHHVFQREVDAVNHVPCLGSVKVCPHCGRDAYAMDVRFKAPKKGDRAQWAKVAFLAQHGFFFQKVYRKNGDMWERRAYPKSLKDAEAFVQTYSDQAILKNRSHTDGRR